MFPTRTTLVELEKKLKRFSKIDLTIYFSDLMDHMHKICETLDESTEIIDVFKDADYIQSSYHANRGIRVLAIMLAIMLPLLGVFGLYGAYSIIAGGVPQSSPLTFLLLLVIAFIIIGVTLFSLRRRHLI
jgi:magnesium transporter